MVVGNFPLAGKVVVVTGGGSGINLEFVKLALNASARCLIADLRLTEEAMSIVGSNPNRVAFTKCDVANWHELEAIPESVVRFFGKGVIADVWVAGAGVFEPHWSSFLYDTEADHYKTLQINTEHPIKLTRIAMRSCLGANKPCVVLIVASMAGLRGAYSAPIYCASKHAVVGFTKSMARADIEENVKVVAVCPGIVDTPLWTGADAKAVAQQYAFNKDNAIRAADVAQTMMEVIERNQYPGGSIIGVERDDLRRIYPSEQAFAIDSDEMQAFADHCHAPIREVYAKERMPEA